MLKPLPLILACALALVEVPAMCQMEVTCTDAPGAARTNSHYVSNRAPLRASAFVKLPIGAVRPGGWVHRQLELTRDGYTGRLPEISPWCKKEGNAWLDPTGGGSNGWEELPYWLKGYGDLAYILRDGALLAETKVWIEGMLASRQPDGWFGPAGNRTSLDGAPDLWPNMIALNCLQSYYEFTGDQRVLDLMTGYFRWEMGVPEDEFVAGFWPDLRAGDNIESVYWLYNHTGEAWLLDLVHKIHRCSARWDEGMPNWHGVNICQGFREPAVYAVLSGAESDRLASETRYQEVRGLYGVVPGGMFGADENCREGYDDPRQGAETCSMVEFMHSDEMLLGMFGDPVYADRCEEIAFNDFPASQTPDLKGLHYLTSPNQVLLDASNKSPGIQNGGTMFSYDPHNYRCCQHNVSHGWPYYAEHLWMATPDNGLAALLYAESDVTAAVADGAEVTITESTGYPFEERVRFTVETARPVAFPLYIRVPGWCSKPSLKVAGQTVAVPDEAGAYIGIEREWRDGDAVVLDLPFELGVTRWTGNHNAASVRYGPLWFSLKIGERWERYGGTDEWPAYEVHPTTPWNYGLVLDEEDPTRGMSVQWSDAPLAGQPFTVEEAPIRIQARAKRIENWKLLPDLNLIDELQDSPVRSDAPAETVTLIPMGCARLRISSFPVIGDGPDAREWVAPPPLRHEASHVHDSIYAPSDGREPASSGDQTIPRFTWWDHRGTEEWLTYRFEEPREVSAVALYWFDDTGTGQCRVPASWRLEYRDGEAWRPVEARGEYGCAIDAYNEVAFAPVTTDQVRVVVRLQDGFSGGVLEWKVR